VSGPGRILALDYGEKRIGLALSDPLRIIAKPYKVILNAGYKTVLQELIAQIREHCVQMLLVGMPYAVEGGYTPRTQATQDFLDRLASDLDIPVQAWDERYSTDEANAELRKLGYDWKKNREIEDAMAAAMILKSYLETHAHA